MEMSVPLAAHPLADHQSLSEIHQVEGQPTQVEAAEAQDEGKSAAVAPRLGRKVCRWALAPPMGPCDFT
jgi:hypothetical protein